LNTKTTKRDGFPTAIIPQKRLFVWEEIEQLGDLERLRLVLQHMPDEELMRELEKNRGGLLIYLFSRVYQTRGLLS